MSSSREVPAMLTWEENDETGKSRALAACSKAIAEVRPIVRRISERAKSSNIYLDVAPLSVSVRDSFTREDYEAFRREETMPKGPKDTIRASMSEYKRNGLIRNIIDLMTDFVVQGIDMCHPNERIEGFYKEWFRVVKGRSRSERFSNMFLKSGTALVRRENGRIYQKDIEDMKRATAEADRPFRDILPLKPTHREIPCRYTILSPLSVDLLSGPFTSLLGPDNAIYGLKIPTHLAKRLKSPANEIERKMAEKLPPWLKQAIAKGVKTVPLDPAKTRVFHYKKDDDEEWATPMVASILPDCQLLAKMKLCDLAALDGAISNIRVWKLGNLDARIAPNRAMINRLAEQLANNVGGGVIDLIWGPDIELIQSKTDVHNFLGMGKYEACLALIYAGLGVPASLTGESKGGFTNNFLALKTLVERLEYVRQVLVEFWEEEIRLVQWAMGFRFPAVLTFDRMTLNDEGTEKALLIQLADRFGISDESLRERFDLNPEIEDIRIRREESRRKYKKKPPKASQFHDPQQDYQLKKIMAQSGAYSADDLGVELANPKAGKKIPHEVTKPPAPVVAPGMGVKKPGKPSTKKTNKPKPDGGRPAASKDQKKRKQKVVKPRQSVKAGAVEGVAERGAGDPSSLFVTNYARGAALWSALEKIVPISLEADNSSRVNSDNLDVLCLRLRAMLASGGKTDDDTLSAVILQTPEHPVGEALLRKTVEIACQQGQEGRDALVHCCLTVYAFLTPETPEVTPEVTDESVAPDKSDPSDKE